MAYDGATLSFTTVAIAEMRVGTSDPTDDMTGVTGFWYELLDANGAVLFRRITSNPMSAHAEVPSPVGDFTRGQRDLVAGEFELVTPALPDATTLVIVGTDPFDEGQGAPAVALATFNLGGIV
jgi:hypothetical protein